MKEPMAELFSRSKIVILDFAQLSDKIPPEQNIELFFKAQSESGQNPRLPANRQAFNNRMLEQTGCRYLIGRYGEDRAAMLADTPAGKQGRTFHLAIDIFAKEQEAVYAPCDGAIIRCAYEEGFGEYGNYLIIQPKDADVYIFYGHLSKDLPKTGPIKAGQPIARLGDYQGNENGGWSRHLHLQVLTQLPQEGKTPNGYSTKADFTTNSALFPDPIQYFPGWQLR